MARLLFGGTTADWVAVPQDFGVGKVPTMPAKSYSVAICNPDTGELTTDLQDIDGNPIASATSEAGSGKILPFYAPDGWTAVLYDAGYGATWRGFPAEGVPGPAGPGASDADVAGYVTGGGDTQAALDAAYVGYVKGLAGDGSTDDAAKINAAISGVSALGGGVLSLPYTPNGYAVATQITLASGVTLRGEGKVKITYTGTSRAYMVQATAAANIALEGLTINTGGLISSALFQTGASSRVAVRSCDFTDTHVALFGIQTLSGAADVTVEDCTFDGVQEPIYISEGASRVSVRRNRLTNWSNRGIYVRGTTAGGAASDITIEHNTITDFTHASASISRQPIAFHGVDDTPFRRVRVNHNTITGPGKSWTATDPGTADQIGLQDCVGFEVIGNISRDGGDMGITIDDGCHRGLIANNTCTGNDAGGIDIGSTSSSVTTLADISVTGNVAMNNGQNRNGDRADSRTGLRLYQAGGIVVSGNTVSDDQGTTTQLSGVYVSACADVSFGKNQYRNLARRIHNAGGNTGLDFGGDQLPPACKSSDTVRNNTAVVADDPDLAVPVEPDATYLVEMRLYYRTSDTADLGLKFSVPPGAALVWTTAGQQPLGTTVTNAALYLRGLTLANTGRIGGDSTTAPGFAFPVGHLTVGPTGGELVAQWAQDAAEASNTTVHAGSYLRLTRIA